MMPISDNNSDRTRVPYVNYILIAINIVVFVFLQKLGMDQNFILSYATVPQEILTNTDVVTNGLLVTPIPVYATILSSMFMHGSIAHIGGNLLYLWVFGDNLENRMGHLRYLMFYLITGIIATLCHVFYSSMQGVSLFIPSLGASGAISGILGGYLILFPRNEVRVWALYSVFKVPAFISLGLWIVLQFVNSSAKIEGEGGGVAYAAHIGGFLAGVLLVKLFAPRVAVLVAEQEEKSMRRTR